MPNENYTHIALAVDRSGSMYGIAQSMIEGFNEFIEGQRDVDGRATVTLAQFDNEYELVYDMQEIDDIPALELIPRGSTALLDGMGKTMNSVRENIQNLADEERPAKCLFIFITDGGENASREYTRDTVFQMIQDCKDDENINYEFLFLGANQDAISAGHNYGIRAGASMSFAANNQGSRSVYESLTKGVTSYRSSRCKSAEINFSPSDRTSAMGQMDIIPDLDESIIDLNKK